MQLPMPLTSTTICGKSLFSSTEALTFCPLLSCRVGTTSIARRSHRFSHFFAIDYAVSIVDSPGPVSAWQLRLAAEADELLLVTTNELAAIHSTKRALQHLEAAGTPRSRLRLVINRYLKENGLSREAIETGLKLDVFHILPNDYEAVQKAIMEGKAVAPDSRLSRSLDELCERMTGFTRASADGWFSGVRQIFGKKTNNAKVSAGGRR